jgi:hypothetical protein
MVFSTQLIAQAPVHHVMAVWMVVAAWMHKKKLSTFSTMTLVLWLFKMIKFLTLEVFFSFLLTIGLRNLIFF